MAQCSEETETEFLRRVKDYVAKPAQAPKHTSTAFIFTTFWLFHQVLYLSQGYKQPAVEELFGLQSSWIF